MKIDNEKLQNEYNLYLARELVLKKYPLLEKIRLEGEHRADKRNFYLKKAAEIISEMKYPTYWVDFVYLYFLENVLKVTEDKIGVHFNNVTKEITVTVTAATTRREFVSSWSEVEKLQLLASGKRKPLKIGFIAYEATFKSLYNNKKPIKIAIEMQLDEKYSEFDKSTGYENIRQLVSKTKKLLKL
jgi:hypothetical protein